MPLRRDEAESLLRACSSWRDRFILVVLWFGGLRVGEALGLRRSDLHLVPAAAALGCSFPGAHLHVVARDNPNRARANVTPHMFRHATAIGLLARGVSIDVVKELLGHASIRSTELYLHPDADAQRSAVERLGPLSFGQAT